jgi:DNA-binding NtrC family response regulator
LHRTIRKFRRAQAGRYSIESLLGSSAAIQKVRAQVAAAVASGANTLICGPPGSGRGHVARAIHYCAASDGGTRLVPVDCQLLTDEVLRRVMDSLRALRGEVKPRATLLIENLELMSAVHQSLLLSAIRQNALVARIIATSSSHVPSGVAEVESAEKSELKDAGQEHDNDGKGRPTRHPAMPSAGRPVSDTIEPNLVDAISTITIRMPRLADRLEDLPVMAQYFLEACNQGSSKQVGSLRSDALDLLALYSWPGELDQLQETITAAHRASTLHEITPADLPKIVHHSLRAATRTRRMPERIVLDELLGMIEKEAIVRALAQAGGNKSEAAGLLGMTRPRLYRRLVQLGLAGEGDEVEREQPEFIERDPTE